MPVHYIICVAGFPSLPTKSLLRRFYLSLDVLALAASDGTTKDRGCCRGCESVFRGTATSLWRVSARRGESVYPFSHFHHRYKQLFEEACTYG